MNRHESKYQNTARLMDEALLLLLEKTDYAFLTVTNICKKAGVNRTTFYLHYETMDDLLQETLAYTTKRFEERYANEPIDPLADMKLIQPKYVLPYLRYLKEYRKLYLASLTQQKVFGVDKYTENALTKIVYPILEKFGVPETERPYTASFYVSGMHSLVMTWVKNGCKEDEDYICGLMMNYAQSLPTPEV